MTARQGTQVHFRLFLFVLENSCKTTNLTNSIHVVYRARLKEGWVVRVPVLRVDCEIYPPRKVFLSLPYVLQQILSKSWTSIFQTRFFACFRRFARLTCLEPNPAVFQRRDPIDFPRCALKKGCAQFQHLIVSAFTWRFRFYGFWRAFSKRRKAF